jgi:hypothetical protein
MTVLSVELLADRLAAVAAPFHAVPFQLVPQIAVVFTGRTTLKRMIVDNITIIKNVISPLSI